MSQQGLSSLLEQLTGRVKGVQNDDETIYQLVEDLAEICLQGVTSESTGRKMRLLGFCHMIMG